MLYGTTYRGGANHAGQIFSLTPPAAGQTAWGFNVLYTFSDQEDNYPEGRLALDQTGVLYGTTDGGVFQLRPPPAGSTVWDYREIVTFSDAIGINVSIRHGPRRWRQQIGGGSGDLIDGLGCGCGPVPG